VNFVAVIFTGKIAGKSEIGLDASVNAIKWFACRHGIA